MKNYTILRGLAALALFTCVSSCQDEEFGYTLDDVRKGQYAREFEQTFGKVDPNQDWTMATLVKANINLPQIQGVSKMNIMTGDPHLASTRLLAQIMLQDGVGTIDFDAIKGNNNVFVTVEQDGKYRYYGSCSIEKGMLNVGSFAPTAEPVTNVATRSIAAEPSKNGDPVSIDVISFVPTEDYIEYKGDRKSKSDWISFTKNNPNILNDNTSPFTDESLYQYSKVKDIDWDKVELKSDDYVKGTWKGYIFGDLTTTFRFYPNGDAKKYDGATGGTRHTMYEWKTEAEKNYDNIRSGDYTETIFTLESLQASLVVETCKKSSTGAFVSGLKTESSWTLKKEAKIITDPVHPQWQYVNNVPKSVAPAWSRGFGYTLFGPGGFFEESKKYFESPKTNLYSASDIPSLEQGVEIITTGGPISLPYIFGCTAFTDQFGYIYWKDGEDPLLKPHYVLMEDARPSQNIYYDSWGNVTPGMDNALSNWYDGYQNAYDQRNSSDPYYCSEHPDEHDAAKHYLLHANRQVFGTTYTLTYFDELGNASSSFPSGLHLAFFIDKVNPSGSGVSYEIPNYSYSLPSLNTRIFSGTLAGPTYHQRQNWRSKEYTGAVKAVTWVQDGNCYIGFEDGGNDEDENDIVLMVSGSFTPVTPVKLSSIKWHLNYNQIHQDDDLFEMYSLSIGKEYAEPQKEPRNGTLKFLGWSTTPDNSSNDLSKTVSGTVPQNIVHYYAIWEEIPVGPDPKPQSWLFACEDLGGSHDYDFNDVVWEVKKEWNNGVCTGTVEVLAAGGTLPFTLLFKGETVCTKKQAFSSIDSEKVIVNSGVSTTDPYENGLSSSPIKVSGINADWSADKHKEDFTLAVETNSNERIYISAYKKGEEGKSPQVLVVPSNWEWPTEGTNIKDAYPRFGTEMDWSEKVRGNVCHRDIEEPIDDDAVDLSAFGSILGNDGISFTDDQKNLLETALAEGKTNMVLTLTSTGNATIALKSSWSKTKGEVSVTSNSTSAVINVTGRVGVNGEAWSGIYHKDYNGETKVTVTKVEMVKP